MSAIALLGGSHFIGYHLLCTLHRRGHQVTLFNRGITCPPAPFPYGVNIINGDRNRPKDLEALFNKNFDVVLDLSGCTPNHIKPIIQNYLSRIGHYIFCSSCAVYKLPPATPLNEESPLTFTRNTYGGDKALIESLLIEQYREFHWPVTIFRPQGVFGQYDTGQPTRQLGFVLSRTKHSAPIPVKSENNPRFNLLYVDDLVNAFILAIANPVSHGKIYGVASDEITTELDTIELIGKICSRKPNIHFYNNPDYDNIKIGNPWSKYDWVTDNTKIKTELGLDFTPMEKALRKTLAWLENTPNHLVPNSFHGERYILKNRSIPKIIRLYWKYGDGIRLFKNYLYRRSGIGGKKLLIALRNLIARLQ